MLLIVIMCLFIIDIFIKGTSTRNSFEEQIMIKPLICIIPRKIYII